MEESTTYTLQEIEKLKSKITGYRNTLLSLKTGSSFEDIQMLKKEFEVLKIQLMNMESLTKTMEEKQHTQNEVYEEQVEKLTNQIASLNQNVEDLNGEIILILKKINIHEDEKINESSNQRMLESGHQEDRKPKDVNESSSTPKMENNSMRYIKNGITEQEHVPIITSIPTYMQLRSLTKQAIQLQKEEVNIAPLEDYEENKEKELDQRYYNQRHFQKINHSPILNKEKNQWF